MLKHVSILDPMRGLAALGVVMFHYSGAILPSIKPNPVADFFGPAKFGVEVFFAISGFIIPYAMFRSGYQWAHYGNFMARRFIRIGPPAYVAAGLMILFHSMAFLLTGDPVDVVDWPGVDIRSILGNLLFHPSLFGTVWYNFAFWSLMVEFHFYLLIGILLPLLLDPSKQYRTAGIILMILVVKLFDTSSFFYYSPYFILGLLVFLLQNGLLGQLYVGILTLVAGSVCLLDVDQIPLLFALVTCIVILSRLTVEWKALILLGDISYSLYITHVPIGYFAERLMVRITDLHESAVGKVVLLVLYMLIALAAAWVFYRWVELPFHSLSRTLKRRMKVGPMTGWIGKTHA